MNETIVACATASGRAGVAVIRISGPQVPTMMVELCGKVLKPRLATHCQFGTPAIDIGLAIYFPAPHSFTGEHVLELQGHGGPVIVDALIAHCLQFGARLARPGEFSERAYLNNKIDLTQAEAIADIIDSSTQTAMRSALRSLQGEFSTTIQAFKQAIINLRIQVEAMIDFPEEEVEEVISAQISESATALLAQLEHIMSRAKQGALIRDGLSVVIIGKPNVGKSTLLNALAQKDAAIVTDIPGTTRDVMRERILIDDLPLHIIDTAGLRESQDVVELEGMKRAWSEVAKADHILYLYDINEPPTHEVIEQLMAESPAVPLTLIANKIDVGHAQAPLPYELPTLLISAKTGEGLSEFKQYLKRSAGWIEQQEDNFIARRRHLDALDRSANAIQQALAQLNQHQSLDCVAEEFRLAQNALSEITGEFSSDDLLGEIFSTFCIGK